MCKRFLIRVYERMPLQMRWPWCNMITRWTLVAISFLFDCCIFTASPFDVSFSSNCLLLFDIDSTLLSGPVSGMSSNFSCVQCKIAMLISPLNTLWTSSSTVESVRPGRDNNSNGNSSWSSGSTLIIGSCFISMVFQNDFIFKANKK